MYDESPYIRIPGGLVEGSQFGSAAELVSLLAKWSELPTWRTLAACRRTVATMPHPYQPEHCSPDPKDPPRRVPLPAPVRQSAQVAGELEREYERIWRLVVSLCPKHFGKLARIEAIASADVPDLMHRARAMQEVFGLVMADTTTESPPPPPLREPDPHPLLVASQSARLINTEAKVVKAIADGGGKVTIATADMKCEGDAVSAFKRAKPKLIKHGWRLYQLNNKLRAEPLK